MIHIVKQGEYLSLIAQKYGIPNWQTLYNHPNNAEFRKNRPNPNLIYPGDKLFIPGQGATPTPGPTPAPTPAPGASEFNLMVVDALTGGAYPKLHFSLRLPNMSMIEAVTDANGMIRLTGPNITRGMVTILSIRDKNGSPEINFDHYGQSLSTEASHLLRIPKVRPVADDVASKHSIIRRSVWGKRTPNYASMEPDWNYGIAAIHHSGNGGLKDPVAIESKHMGERGYSDVGYHFMIAPSGQIYEGRCLWLKGSHILKANTGKVGILIMGDFHPWKPRGNNWDDAVDIWTDQPTQAQLNAAEGLIRTLRMKFGSLGKLGGHRDYGSSECPGDILYAMLPGMRKNVGLGGP